MLCKSRTQIHNLFSVFYFIAVYLAKFYKPQIEWIVMFPIEVLLCPACFLQPETIPATMGRMTISDQTVTDPLKSA